MRRPTACRYKRNPTKPVARRRRFATRLQAHMPATRPSARYRTPLRAEQPTPRPHTHTPSASAGALCASARCCTPPSPFPPLHSSACRIAGPAPRAGPSAASTSCTGAPACTQSREKQEGSGRAAWCGAVCSWSRGSGDQLHRRSWKSRADERTAEKADRASSVSAATRRGGGPDTVCSHETQQGGAGEGRAGSVSRCRSSAVCPETPAAAGAVLLRCPHLHAAPGLHEAVLDVGDGRPLHWPAVGSSLHIHLLSLHQQRAVRAGWWWWWWEGGGTRSSVCEAAAAAAASASSAGGGSRNGNGNCITYATWPTTSTVSRWQHRTVPHTTNLPSLTPLG